MFWRRVKYFAVNIAFWYCLYLAYFTGQINAERVVVFYAWFCFAISLVALSEPAIDSIRKRGLCVPIWFDGCLDIAATIIFVWFGSMWTGAAFFIHMLLINAAKEKAKEPVK